MRGVAVRQIKRPSITLSKCALGHDDNVLGEDMSKHATNSDGELYALSVK